MSKIKDPYKNSKTKHTYIRTARKPAHHHQIINLSSNQNNATEVPLKIHSKPINKHARRKDTARKQSRFKRNEFKYIKNRNETKQRTRRYTWIPCSRQYSSQHALPTWIPAWPMWIEMHSLILLRPKEQRNLKKKSTKNEQEIRWNEAKEEEEDWKWRRRRLWRRLLLKMFVSVENEEEGEGFYSSKNSRDKFVWVEIN